MLKKYCKDTLPTEPLKTGAGTVFIKFVKGSAASTFSVKWTSEDVTCCSKVTLANHDNRNGDYVWDAASEAYKNADTNELLYSLPSPAGWFVGADKSAWGIQNFVSNYLI